jgi:hypothetical protein
MAFKRSWFPPADQVMVLKGRNISYFHSLWIGLTVPLLNMPIIVFRLIVMPLLHGLFNLIAVVVALFVLGVSGRALGYEVVKDGETQSD